MRVLQHRITGPETCPYLSGPASTTESLVMTGIEPAQLERLLELGWRRFGPLYFRPVCKGCAQCISVRVPIATFAPSVNLRRVEKRGRELRVEVGQPVVDEERLALYRRWHATREKERGWRPDLLDKEGYAMQFCFPHPSAREFTYREGDRLVGVGIMDETPRALSAVYFYFDPERAGLSPGTLNVLTAISQARALGKQHVYLGYRVEECPSLRYKGRFRPQEALQGRPELGEEPRWVVTP